MNTNIRAQGFDLLPSIEQRVHRQLSRSAGRFERELMSVDVYLSDINGPRGGADKKVVMRANLTNLPPISISTRHADLYVAIDRTARRLERNVNRALRKSRRLQPRKVLRLKQYGWEQAAT